MTETITPPTIGELLTEYRTIIDRREDLSREEKMLNDRRTVIEKSLMAISESTGSDTFSNEFLHVTVKDEMRVKYDPQRWDDFVRDCVAHNNIHLIQRRVTDARVLNLMESGQPLPVGLELEPFTKVSYRRK